MDFYDNESKGAALWSSLKRFCVSCFYTIKYPRLKAKYNKLLVQVRFHEMRVHFLQSYDLPLKLKVSTYLMRSEQQVIKHLIHVSTSAWLWLTGLICVLYYITGITTDITKDREKSLITLAAFFYIQMILFILISMWLYYSMQGIFMQIMEMKHLWSVDEEDDDVDDRQSARFSYRRSASSRRSNSALSPTSKQENHGHAHCNGAVEVNTEERESTDRRFADANLHHSLATEQLRLFFLDDPKIVVIIIQFMQFGYAIALSVIVVFWDDINAGNAIDAEVYLIVTLVCYLFYVYVTAKMLPKYTMCTSLGQLVNRKRLHETVAVFRLEEAERRRQESNDAHMGHCYPAGTVPIVTRNGTAATPVIMQPSASKLTMPVIKEHDSPHITSKPIVDLSQLREPLPIAAQESIMSVPLQDVMRAPLETPPLSRGPPQDIMPLLPGDSAGALSVPLGFQVPVISKKPRPSMGMPAIDEKKAATIEPEKASLLVDFVKMDTKSLREAMPLGDIRKAERRDRKRNRRKSVSDGVALMASLGKAGQNLNFFGAGVANDDENNNKDKEWEVAESKFKTKIRDDEEGNAPSKFAVDDSALLKRRERRRNRKKAVSASAASGLANDFWKSNLKEVAEKSEAQVHNEGAAQTTDIAPSTRPLFSKSNIPLHAADDSVVATTYQQQRRQRRQNRKKSLSASAAIKLMQVGNDFQIDENKLDKKSMMEFWRVPSGDGATTSREMDIEEDDASNKEQPRVNRSRVPDKLESLQEESEHHEDSSSYMDPPVISPSRSSIEDGGQFGQRELPLEKIGSDRDSDSGINNDEETVETDKSIGGLSDVGDADNFNSTRYSSFYDENEEDYVPCSTRLARLNNDMRRFFLSKTSAFVTHMLGTTLCFFLIGMRVESFLQQQCIIPHDDDSWDLDLHIDFWSVTFWLFMFLVISTYNIILFPAYKEIPYEEQEKEIVGTKAEHWIIFLAAAIDIVISFTCLMIFFGAEIQRCCDGNEYPVYDSKYSTSESGYALENETYSNITDSYTTGDSYEPTRENFSRFLAGGYEAQSEVEECIDTTLYCNCPTFGKRHKGGLGKVEPFAALILLRLFRFLLARVIVQRFDLGNEPVTEELNGYEKSKRSVAITPSTKHGGSHGHGKFKSGTIVELWQAAISEHPEIVEKYGEFSGELLQAMLGVDIFEQRYPLLEPDAKQPSTGGPSPAGVSEDNEPLHRGFQSTGNIVKDSNETHLTGNKKYSKLAPEVQEIILAGELGMPVKSRANLSRVPSARAGLDKAVTGGPLEFEVDHAQLEMEKYDSLSAFEFPNARLVRSMRRCERKLIPLLDKWSLVDVVLTKHEMVYVHISENDGSDRHEQLREAGKMALKATKGGRGLRLCDVVAGRKVIGHLTFSEIISVHVERKIRKSGTVLRSPEEVATELGHGHSEFWQESLDGDRIDSSVDIEKRWEAVNQDALKIQTIHGTLYLRFLSDLEDSEAHPELLVDEPDFNHELYKDISLQWAETIVRQCAIGQLKQPLSHSGMNDNDELKELLQIVHQDERRHHRRFHSGGIHHIYHSKGHKKKKSRHTSELPTFNFDTIQEDIESGIADAHPLKENGREYGGAPPVPQRRKITRFASDGDEGYTSATSDIKTKSVG